jgi:Sec-independent protein translocase protein TatA
VVFGTKALAHLGEAAGLGMARRGREVEQARDDGSNDEGNEHGRGKDKTDKAK